MCDWVQRHAATKNARRWEFLFSFESGEQGVSLVFLQLVCASELIKGESKITTCSQAVILIVLCKYVCELHAGSACPLKGGLFECLEY